MGADEQPGAAVAGQDPDEEAAGPLTVFSDYVCPFCYLGRASLETYQDGREEPLETEWHPFDLRGYKRDESGEIREDVDDGKDEAYFEQVRENVARLADEFDVDIDLDAVPDIDSWDAQKAALYVREEHPDRFEAFDDALFEAFWTEHRDIGYEAVILDVAESVGLDRDELADVLASEAWDERLEEEFREARQLGVTGVPTFAYDRHAARGAVPPAQLERLVEGAQ